jgi:hypothetical protein
MECEIHVRKTWKFSTYLKNTPSVHYKDHTLNVVLGSNCLFFSRTSSTCPIVGVEGYCCTWPHKMRHKSTLETTFLDDWSAPCRGFTYTAHNKNKMIKIHTPIRFRTRFPSSRATADLRLRQRCYRDRIICVYSENKSKQTKTLQIKFSAVISKLVLWRVLCRAKRIFMSFSVTSLLNDRNDLRRCR